MGRIFEEKKPFRKSHTVIDTKKDFDMEQQHQIALWKDPSGQVVKDFFSVSVTKREELDNMSQDEIDELDDKFYRAVSEIIIDTDIAGISFEKPDEARAAFEHPSIDWMFFTNVLLRYVNDILQEANSLKKIFGHTKKTSNSGESKSEKDER